MCIEEGTAAKRVLDELGIELESLRAVLAEMKEKTESTQEEESTGGLGEDVKRMLEQALAEALAENASMVGTEHLIMAMARDESSTAMRALAMLGVNATQLERQTARVMEEYQRMQEEIQKEEKKDELEKSDVISRRGVSRRKEKDEGGKTPLVDQLATDLTSLAEAGKLDPVIGRTKEIERVIQILARRTKNNPALIGEPGVGKLPLLKGWRSASSKATCLPCCLISAFCSWMLVPWLRERCTAVSLKNASSALLMSSRAVAISSLLTKFTCWLALVQLVLRSMPPTSSSPPYRVVNCR